MAVTLTGKKITMTAATDEFAGPIFVKTIRWRPVTGGGGAATDDLSLVESSAGDTSKIIYEAVAGGANNTEETLKETMLPFGLRIATIDNGELDIHYK